jgi:hypothetical protein
MKEKIAQVYELLFGFRKFIVALLVLVVSIVFRTKALLSGGEFVDLVKAVTLGFFGCNSVEGILEVVKDHLAARKEAGNVLAPPPEKDGNEDVALVLPGDK